MQTSSPEYAFSEIREAEATRFIQSQGLTIASIVLIPEGHNHVVFDILLADGTPLIAKFKKPAADQGERRDSLFGGRLSLEREHALYTLVREQAGLPAPKIRLKYDGGEASFVLVEKLPGKLWDTYLAEKMYSRASFLQSLEYLGRDIAKAQRVRFESFGDIMDAQTILPPGIKNFAIRFMGIMEMRLKRAGQRGVLRGTELEQVRRYFRKNCADLETGLGGEKVRPVFVFTDMHAMNFLVDEQGEPTGYFDLESCQAAHPALEFYGVKFFLFNYFNAETFRQAEEAFFRGFEQEEGRYDRANPVNRRLEALLATGRIMELTESYYGVQDGIRDEWSHRFRELLFDILGGKEVDYIAVSEIFRAKTRQPTQPRG